MRSIAKTITLLAAIMMFASCSSKKSGAVHLTNPQENTDPSKSGIGDDNNIGSLPEDKKEIIETVKDQLVTQFEDSDTDVQAILDQDNGEIDPKVAELIDMDLDSDSMVSLLAEHFNLDPSVIPDLNTNGGGELNEDQIKTILEEQYPDLDLNNLFNVDLDSIGGDDNGMLDAIKNANMDDPTSFLDLLTGAFGSN